MILLSGNIWFNPSNEIAVNPISLSIQKLMMTYPTNVFEKSAYTAPIWTLLATLYKMKKSFYFQDRNDDDAERSSLLASERAVATSSPSLSSPRRPRETMSSSPQKEHFHGCLKLFAENVCTYMSSTRIKHKSTKNNLQWIYHKQALLLENRLCNDRTRFANV